MPTIPATSRGVSAPSRARGWRKPAGLWRDSPRPRCGFQPHGHPRPKRGGIAPRIGADHKRVEIVVADGTGSAPGRELAARDDFVDLGVDWGGTGGRCQFDARADAQAVKLILAQVETG